MDFFRTKLVCIVLAFGMMASALIGALLYYLLPGYYPQWFEAILIFFFILEPLIVVYVEAKSRKATQRQLLNTYMLTKVVKVFASLIFIGIYALTVKEGIKSFVLVFMSLYILYLFIETFVFVKIERHLKEKQQ